MVVTIKILPYLNLFFPERLLLTQTPLSTGTTTWAERSSSCTPPPPPAPWWAAAGWRGSGPASRAAGSGTAPTAAARLGSAFCSVPGTVSWRPAAAVVAVHESVERGPETSTLPWSPGWRRWLRCHHGPQTNKPTTGSKHRFFHSISAPKGSLMAQGFWAYNYWAWALKLFQFLTCMNN